MNKIFLLLGGLLCILLTVQAAGKGGSGGVNEVVHDAAEDDDDVDDTFEEGNGNDDDEEEEQDPEPTTDLNCILFGDSGCDAFCSSISYLYGIAGNGKCAEDRSCGCTLHKKQQPTLQSLWSEKFKPNATSKKILQTFESDSEFATEVEEILQRFPRTPSDTRDELIEEALGDIQGIEKLQIKDVQLPVQKYIKEGNVDRKNLQQDLSQILQRALSDKRFPVKDVDYASKLKKFLNEVTDDQTTKQYVEDNINKTDNTALKKLIDPKSDNKPYDFSNVRDLPSYDAVSQYVAATVTDEFVKFINNDDKTAKSPKNVKKSPTTLTKTPSKKVQPGKPANVDTSNKYTTPDIDGFTSIGQLRGRFSKTWQLENGEVTIEKAVTGAISLNWQMGNVSADLEKFVTGAVEQNWKFGNIKIKLIRHVTRAIDQYWEIQGKRYEYHRYVTGRVDDSDDVPEQHRVKLEREIELWCQQNKRLFPYDACTIYKER